MPFVLCNPRTSKLHLLKEAPLGMAWLTIICSMQKRAIEVFQEHRCCPSLMPFSITQWREYHLGFPNKMNKRVMLNKCNAVSQSRKGFVSFLYILPGKTWLLNAIQNKVTPCVRLPNKQLLHLAFNCLREKKLQIYFDKFSPIQHHPFWSNTLRICW